MGAPCLAPNNWPDFIVVSSKLGPRVAVLTASGDRPLLPQLQASYCVAANRRLGADLLQESFCTGDEKFCGLQARLSCKDVRDLIA
jgi:hypothetical protein